MTLKTKHIFSSNKFTVGITIGDPSGIGPEVVTKALSSGQISRFIQYIVIGDRFALSKSCTKKLKGHNLEILDIPNINRKRFCFGRVCAKYGRASMNYLDTALELIAQKKINALVTAPISKESVNLAGYKISGHTEYLADKTKTKKFAMMLLARDLRITLATRHLALNKVSKNLNTKDIYSQIILTYNAVKRYFWKDRPRIAVCALNPHLGEDGLLGNEEQIKIKPAIRRARVRFKTIYGPIASDIVFRQALDGKFDAVVAMYHDQALIPLKTIYFNRAVNLTIGLPFVRTSPCHGTGFDIAGKNRADPTSMIEAIKLACRLAKY